MSGLTVLFVCTGNICRSPMAEYLLRQQVPESSGWRVRSAGVAAPRGMPASRPAIEALEEIGIDLRAHQSRLLTQEMIADATLIVVMTTGHRRQVWSTAPGAAHKVALLKSFDPAASGTDVEDPIGSSLEVYREVREELRTALPGLMAFMDVLRGKKTRI
jgi:protein-tyrosine-phosphatase